MSTKFLHSRFVRESYANGLGLLGRRIARFVFRLLHFAGGRARAQLRLIFEAARPRQVFVFDFETARTRVGIFALRATLKAVKKSNFV